MQWTTRDRTGQRQPLSMPEGFATRYVKPSSVCHAESIHVEQAPASFTALFAVIGCSMHSCQVARGKSSGNCQTAAQAAILSSQRGSNLGWNGDLLVQT